MRDNADLIMKDFAAQEKVLRDALKVKPNDIPLRIQLAEMLEPSLRPAG